MMKRARPSNERKPTRLSQHETGTTETSEQQRRRRRLRVIAVTQGNGLLDYTSRNSFRIPALLFVLWMMIFLGLLIPLLEQQHRETSEVVNSIKVNKAGPGALISASISLWREEWGLIKDGLSKYTTTFNSDPTGAASKEDFDTGVPLVPAPSEHRSVYQDIELNELRKKTTISISDTVDIPEQFVNASHKVNGLRKSTTTSDTVDIASSHSENSSTNKKSHTENELRIDDNITSDIASHEEFVDAGQMGPEASDESHIQNDPRKKTTSSNTSDTASKEEFVAGQLVPAPVDNNSTYHESHLQDGLRNDSNDTSIPTPDTASKEELVAGQLVPAPADNSSTYYESHMQDLLGENTTTFTSDTIEKFVAVQLVPAPADISSIYRESQVQSGFRKSTSDNASKEEVVASKLVLAPSDSTNTYKDMERMCTLRRYTHLLGKFCDPIDRSSCDLHAFKVYFENNSAKENLIGGCPFDEAVCYAKRYPDLFHSEYCNGNYTKCKYYSLRNHYEQYGMKERRAWGCDFQPIELAAPVSWRQPADTISMLPVSTKRENVLGKASLEIFQGSWEPVEFNQDNIPSESICPKEAVYVKRFCNLGAREGYQPAHYVANGLPEWSTKRFKESMAKDGGHSIGFVGDSLMHQLRSELQCQSEADDELLDNLHYYEVFMATLPDTVQEQFEVRPHSDRVLNIAFSLEWVDKAIADGVKYLVFNTGAWWNPSSFMKRGQWCKYDRWRKATHEELVSMYTTTMEQTLLPIFTSLVENHGVIPIWMDTPPAGKMNLTTGENYDINQWGDYYRIFPRLNEIGRKMMVQAGGLVLPLWDVTFTRSMDHMFHDNPEAEDQLHYCVQYQNSVPIVWARLLSQVLYGNGEEIEADNVNSEPRPLLRSIQGVKEKNIRVGQEAVEDVNGQHTSQQHVPFDMDHRKLAENRAVSFVRLSRSNESPCACADAKIMNQCRANIRCSWSNVTESCSDRL